VNALLQPDRTDLALTLDALFEDLKRGQVTSLDYIKDRVKESLLPFFETKKKC